jgi:hypothetical protein
MIFRKIRSEIQRDRVEFIEICEHERQVLNVTFHTVQSCCSVVPFILNQDGTDI